MTDFSEFEPQDETPEADVPAPVAEDAGAPDSAEETTETVEAADVDPDADADRAALVEETGLYTAQDPADTQDIRFVPDPTDPETKEEDDDASPSPDVDDTV